MFLTAALAATAAAPSLALAGPTTAERAPAPAAAPARPQAPTDDAARYAAREQATDPAVAQFQGGAAYVAIGGTTLAIVALVVLLIILL